MFEKLQTRVTRVTQSAFTISKGNLKGTVPWWASLGYQQFNGNIGTIQPSNRPSACRASMGVAFLPYAGRCPVPSKYVTRFGLRSPPHMAAPHYPGETCGMLVKLGSLSKVSLQKGWTGGLILCKLTKDVCFQKQTTERWNLTVDLWPCDV